MTGDLLDRRSYIDAVRLLYLNLPHSSARFSRADRQLAAALFDRQLPLPVIRSAFLLASAPTHHPTPGSTPASSDSFASLLPSRH